MAENRLKTIDFRNFSGGLNTRDLSSELTGNEFPYGLNVTIDERGGVMKRLGYTDRYGAAVGTGLVNNLFWWGTQGKLVAQVGAAVHVDGGAAIYTFTTSARVGMCEFLGNLVMIHPVDGMKIWNGSAISTPTNAPVGNTCFPWQNKLWSGGDPSNPPRLYYSDIGSANRTSADQYTDIREKDSALITCIQGAAGIDIAGRPGLLVFKKNSAYRVNDSATGAYTTIDASQGAGSNIAAVTRFGRTYTINENGIWSTDGLDSMREESSLIENLFHRDRINQDRPDLMAAGHYQDRVYFSFPLAGETENGREIELHPIQRWVVAHSKAGSAYATTNTHMVFGSPSADGRVYNSHVGGSDAGVAIASSFQTRWLEPSDGYKSRLRRMRFVGQGEFVATVLKDYEQSGSAASLGVSILSDSAVYDDGFLYDDGALYGPTRFQGVDDHYSIGVARAVSVRIDETSSISTTGRPILDGATTPEIGAWTLSHISLLAIDLGIN